MVRPIAPFYANINRRTFLKAAGATTLGAATLLSACGTGSSDTQITLQHWYSPHGEAGSKDAAVRYAKDYTKVNPNIRVNVTWVPTDYTTKLSTALLSPNPPDVFESAPPSYAQIKANLFEPLDDLYPPAIKADFHPQDLQALTVNNHIYGVKTMEDYAIVYYRKSMFAKAGIGIPSTLDELISAAKALTTDKVKGLFVGNNGGARGYVYYVQAPLSAGVKLIDDEKKQVAFKSDKLTAVLGKFHELDASGALLDGAPTDCFDPGAFVSGLCAMQWCGMWGMPAIQKQWGDDFDVFPFPSIDATVQPGVWYAGWGDCISPKSRHLAEAKQYVKWLTIDNTQIQIDWCTNYGFHVPPRLSVAAQATPLKTGVALKSVQLLQQYGQITSPYWDDKMYAAFSTAVGNAEQGKDPKNEVNTAYQTCVQELQQELG